MYEEVRTSKPRIWLDATHDSDEDNDNEPQQSRVRHTMIARAPIEFLPPPPVMPTTPRSSQPLITTSPPTAERQRPKSLNQGRLRKKERPQHGPLSSQPSSSPVSQPPPQPSSPGVISSLIHSLGNIPPTQHEPTSAASSAYMNGGSSTSSPMVRPMRSFGGSSGPEYMDRNPEFRALQTSLLRELADLDDAAEPPVVRTSKRPSGQSDWKATKAKKEGSNLRAYLKAGMRSKSASSLGSDDRSIESNLEDNNSEALSQHLEQMRTSLGSRSSARNDWAKDPIAAGSLAAQDYSFATRPRGASTNLSIKKPHAFDSPIGDVSTSAGPPLSPISVSGASIRNLQRESSKKRGKKPSLESNSAGPAVALTSGLSVPFRRSSLRTDVPVSPSYPPPPSQIPNPLPAVTPLQHSRDSSLQYFPASIVPEVQAMSPPRPQIEAVHKPEVAIIPQPEPKAESKSEPKSEPEPTIASALPAASEPESMPQSDPVKEQPVLSDEDDTQVTRRIKELKAQKEQREKLARESLKSDAAIRTPIFLAPLSNRTSGTIDPAQSSPNEDAFQKPEVKDFTGTRVSILPAEVMQPRLSPRPSIVDHVVNDEQPARPPTPMALPINYNHVLKLLDKDHSPPNSTTPSATGAESAPRPTTSAAMGVISSSATVSNGVRPKSMSASRAPNPRKDATKSMIPELFRRATASDSPLSPSDDQGSVIGKKSIDSTAPSVASTTKRSNSKKKRWSHPELPANSSDKRTSVFDSKYAVKSPDRPATVVEEPRVKSIDPIDTAVGAFIHASRLSQKVADPNTGRTISFSEVGDPDGHVVVCCVGMGLTRYVMAFYDELAVTLKLRLITPDRPGVGESQPNISGTPLSWPDDVVTIINALGVTRFSIMAHSAGAIYALATAIKMPRNIRGKIHLLAPWIPPSQMAPLDAKTSDAPPSASLPRAQRFLRVLPAPLLKVANSGFLGTASISLYPQTSMKHSKKLRKSYIKPEASPTPTLSSNGHEGRESLMLMDQQSMPNGSTFALTLTESNEDSSPQYISPATLAREQAEAEAEEEARRATYDERLTLAIWDRATTNANPAIDLIVCLERNNPIGFRYADVTRAVVIHHGAKDSRVPAENVKWLGRTMKRCEVRILAGEGHGLMANAAVMANVLGEVSSEWEEWDRAITGGAGGASPIDAKSSSLSMSVVGAM